MPVSPLVCSSLSSCPSYTVEVFKEALSEEANKKNGKDGKDSPEPKVPPLSVTLTPRPSCSINPCGKKFPTRLRRNKDWDSFFHAQINKNNLPLQEIEESRVIPLSVGLNSKLRYRQNRRFCLKNFRRSGNIVYTILKAHQSQHGRYLNQFYFLVLCRSPFRSNLGYPIYRSYDLCRLFKRESKEKESVSILDNWLRKTSMRKKFNSDVLRFIAGFLCELTLGKWVSSYSKGELQKDILLQQILTLIEFNLFTTIFLWDQNSDSDPPLFPISTEEIASPEQEEKNQSKWEQFLSQDLLEDVASCCLS